VTPATVVSGLSGMLNAALPDTGARVAVVSVDADPPLVLSVAEWARATGFRFAKRRREWIGGRAAAKLALVQVLGDSSMERARDITVETGPAGEPIVVNGHHNPLAPFGVSIAHAGGLAAAVAFPLARPIGLDLEPIANIDPELAGLACTPRERLLVERYEAGLARTEALLRIWTAKEAAVKLTRTGLGVPLLRVTVQPTAAGLTEFEVTLPASVGGASTTCRVRVLRLGRWIASLAWF